MTWHLNDIDWGAFDIMWVDPSLLALVRASSLIEGNAEDYRQYLHNVFADDAEFCIAIDEWAADERRHGEALGAWARLADPNFELSQALKRFRSIYQIPVTAKVSVRGSLAAELLARCAVETGTSSFYSALSEVAAEPVLHEICRRIAGDELRHYKMFYKRLQMALAAKPASPWRQASTILARAREVEDDELACAWHAANVMPIDPERPYDREACRAAYLSRAYALYQPHHIRRGVAMMAKAAGFDPNGLLGKAAQVLTQGFITRRARHLATATYSN